MIAIGVILLLLSTPTFNIFTATVADLVVPVALDPPDDVTTVVDDVIAADDVISPAADDDVTGLEDALVFIKLMPLALAFTTIPKAPMPSSSPRVNLVVVGKWVCRVMMDSGWCLG